MRFGEERRDRAGQCDSGERAGCTCCDRRPEDRRSVVLGDGLFRCTRAAPRAGSENTTANPENVSAIAAKPNWCAVRRWASTNPTTTREPWAVVCDMTFQPSPLITFRRNSSGRAFSTPPPAAGATGAPRPTSAEEDTP